MEPSPRPTCIFFLLKIFYFLWKKNRFSCSKTPPQHTMNIIILTELCSIPYRRMAPFFPILEALGLSDCDLFLYKLVLSVLSCLRYECFHNSQNIHSQVSLNTEFKISFSFSKVYRETDIEKRKKLYNLIKKLIAHRIDSDLIEFMIFKTLKSFGRSWNRNFKPIRFTTAPINTLADQ